MDKKEKISGKFTDFMGKASELGKKAADTIQKGAKATSDWSKKTVGDISEQTQKTIHDQKMKQYNPLFKEYFFSEEFHSPNVIKIVDDAERREIEVCEGAIGWTQRVKNVETLFLYDEFVKESKIKFVPFAKCDKIYCLDSFEKGRYISSDTVFESSLKEKMAELENVAYCLGAKSYSIEMVEESSSTSQWGVQINGRANEINTTISQNESTEKRNYQSGRNITYLAKNDNLQKPKLKWFEYDENINNLIKICLSGESKIISKQLVFRGSTSETISREIAVAIDALQKINFNGAMQQKFNKEQRTLMIFDVEF